MEWPTPSSCAYMLVRVTVAVRSSLILLVPFRLTIYIYSSSIYRRSQTKSYQINIRSQLQLINKSVWNSTVDSDRMPACVSFTDGPNGIKTGHPNRSFYTANFHVGPGSEGTTVAFTVKVFMTAFCSFSCAKHKCPHLRSVSSGVGAVCCSAQCAKRVHIPIPCYTGCKSF